MSKFVNFLQNVISQDGTKVTPESISGKVIGLYFSAHWCGPCRSFTPKLVEKYNEIIAAGNNLEIIFISADEDEDSALSYFSAMPWKMIAFSDRENESLLSAELGINGIPALVLIDEEGSLITKNGREAIMTVPFDKLREFEAGKIAADEKAAHDLEELKHSFNPSVYFGGNVIDKEGNVLSTSAFEGKTIGLYFSAHWCGPCRQFTPLLTTKYEELISSGKSFEIIFISSDRDEESSREYFASMPWKMLTFSERGMKSTLSRLFNITGIPSLVLVDADGSTISAEARQPIMNVPFEEIKSFEAEKKLLEAKLEAEILHLPESVEHPSHEHPLIKLPKVYGGQYSCDICSGSGKGWVYHCEDCGFDAHPRCVVMNTDK